MGKVLRILHLVFIALFTLFIATLLFFGSLDEAIFGQGKTFLILLDILFYASIIYIIMIVLSLYKCKEDNTLFFITYFLSLSIIVLYFINSFLKIIGPFLIYLMLILHVISFVVFILGYFKNKK